MRKFSLIFLFLMLLNTKAVIVFSFEETSEFSAHGTNIIREEQEDKLWVPVDKADEVWNFLETRFVKDQKHLKSINPDFASYWYLEEFWDTYYDTPTFDVYKNRNGVRHRRRINHTDPTHNKSGRELMQIKINDPDLTSLNRSEIKFVVEPTLNKESGDDKHPMIGLVKSKQRDDFKLRLKELGLNPYSMRAVLTVHDMRSRIYITQKGLPFMSISFDRADTSMWWAKYNFIEIEPELNEIPYTEGDAATRQYMEKILTQVVKEIRTEFPYIKQNLTPKYSKSFDALKAQLPFFPLLVKTGTNNFDGMLIIIGGTLALIIFLGVVIVKNIKTQILQRKNKA